MRAASAECRAWTYHIGERIMRKFQIVVFVLATASLITAACMIGKEAGNEFRRIGIAALLFDVVCIQLWPAAKQR
jgi:hypothetical protein